jgi:hypothetical protein
MIEISALPDREAQIDAISTILFQDSFLDMQLTPAIQSRPPEVVSTILDSPKQALDGKPVMTSEKSLLISMF